jgi:thymidylate kinase
MIIEFFGPPCVGKTTLAQALHRQLEDRGHNVRLISSYRPAEKAPAGMDRTGAAVLQRLVRAVLETGALMREQAANPDRQATVATALLRLLPPSGIGGSVRMNQYLSRLARNWRLALAEQHITVFDQAFVQAVYSLALLNGRADRQQLESALSLVPMPDILIGLNVPRHVLTARLAERQRRQGRLERLLEVSPETNLAAVPMFDILDDLLQNRNVRMLRVDTDGDHHFGTILCNIEEAVQAGKQHKLEAVSG